MTITHVLVSVPALFEQIPEMQVLYRFLPHEDMSVLRWLLQGPPTHINADWQRQPDLQELAYYISDQWELTNTVAMELDTPLLGGRECRLNQDAETHLGILQRLAHSLWPLLGLPDNSRFVHSVSRMFYDPSQVGTEPRFYAPVCYRVEIEQC